MLRKTRSDKGQKRSFTQHLKNIGNATLNSLAVGTGLAGTALISYRIKKPKFIKNLGNKNAKYFHDDVDLQSKLGLTGLSASLPFTIRNEYKNDKYYQNNNPKFR